jgi:hypothetical protein
MSFLELAVLAGAMLSIVVVIVADDRRRNAGRLSGPMLFFLRIVLGIVFAILGVIGSLLPIMQGWIFFLLAALVLFPQSRFAIKACNKIEPRMPRMIGWLRRMGIGVARETHDTMPAE